jgi:hypothetical protein
MILVVKRFGGDLYLLGVPAADRDLLGARPAVTFRDDLSFVPGERSRCGRASSTLRESKVGA